MNVKKNLKNGKYEGCGLLSSLMNNDFWIGTFKNGKINGEGFRIFSNVDNMMVILNYIFHEEGVLFKGNGDILEGHFENWLIKGKDIFYPYNGISYDINTEKIKKILIMK